ncbi:HAD family hydrolase [Flavobacterium myungsuense]|uniref:HAD family hydrolase n=1 Tax=Flavobacterium myungsuense TaxID=651823 RepID=UPI00363CC9FF
MAIGAWRMMKKGIIVKQTKTVETLGSATVICIDKTGTITENKMTLAKIFGLKSKKIKTPEVDINSDEKELIELAMLASEPIPFDPMEVALHKAYSKIIAKEEQQHYKMIHEYPLSGKPPIMTHVYRNKEGKQIIVAKGAPEALMHLSNLSAIDEQEIEKAITTITTEGYRVLGVAKAEFKGSEFPKTQQEFKFIFKGLVSFYDPPKKNIYAVLQDFYTAGINVKIITGDYGLTTTSIAKQVGFKGFDQCITGDELMKLSDSELKKRLWKNKYLPECFLKPN